MAKENQHLEANITLMYALGVDKSCSSITRLRFQYLYLKVDINFIMEASYSVVKST